MFVGCCYYLNISLCLVNSDDFLKETIFYYTDAVVVIFQGIVCTEFMFMRNSTTTL